MNPDPQSTSAPTPDPVLRLVALIVRWLLLALWLYTGVVSTIGMLKVLGHGKGVSYLGLIIYIAITGTALVLWRRLGRWSASRWPRVVVEEPPARIPAAGEVGAIATGRPPAAPTTAGQPARPLTTFEKTVGAGSFVAACLLGGLLALAAAIGGSILQNHYRPLDAACNGAYQLGIATSTSNNIDCGLDTTLYSLGDYLHVVGLIVLIGGAIGLLVILALAPKLRDDLRRLGR
jgi:hypothetical protein